MKPYYADKAFAEINSLTPWLKAAFFGGLFLSFLSATRLLTWLLGPRLKRWRDGGDDTSLPAPEPVTTPEMVENKRRADILTAATSADIRSLNQRVVTFAWNAGCNLDGGDNRIRFIEYKFYVVNGSVFPVEFGIANGKAKFSGKQFVHIPEVQIERVERGAFGMGHLRQELTEDEAMEIVGKHVSLDFGLMSIELIPHPEVSVESDGKKYLNIAGTTLDASTSIFGFRP